MNKAQNIVKRIYQAFSHAQIGWARNQKYGANGMLYPFAFDEIFASSC